MPDLMTITITQCKSNNGERIEFPSASNPTKKYVVTFTPRHTGGNWDAGWNCTCWPFKKNGTCNHVELAKEQHCGWHGGIDGGEAEEYEGKHDVTGEPETKWTCPRCGGEAEPVAFAV